MRRLFNIKHQAPINPYSFPTVQLFRFFLPRPHPLCPIFETFVSLVFLFLFFTPRFAGTRPTKPGPLRVFLLAARDRSRRRALLLTCLRTLIKPESRHASSSLFPSRDNPERLFSVSPVTHCQRYCSQHLAFVSHFARGELRIPFRPLGKSCVTVTRSLFFLFLT